jgi:phospholipid/cholesterol/gamma-HCH transport system permease protein
MVADFMGVAGAYVYAVGILDIDAHFYMMHSRRVVESFDLVAGIIKSMFFGAAIALIGCHRGFNCAPGAEGVGHAATSAFVHSFVMILFLDLVLAIILDAVYFTLWPQAPRLL